MQHTEYLPEYRVVVCRRCKYSVRSSASGGAKPLSREKSRDEKARPGRCGRQSEEMAEAGHEDGGCSGAGVRESKGRSWRT